MIVVIILFCSVIVLVSTNPLASTIPVQTYPVYQQNNYKIPLDVWSRNFNPCTLQNTLQSQSSYYGQSIPLNLRQILFNKFFSRPEAQALLDPQKQLFNFETYKIPENPDVQNFNKYMLLPVEYTNVNDTNKSISENFSKKPKKSGNKKKPKSDKQKGKQCDSKYKQCTETTANNKKENNSNQRSEVKCDKKCSKWSDITKDTNKIKSNKKRNRENYVEENQRPMKNCNVEGENENRVGIKKSRICRRKAKIDEEISRQTIKASNNDTANNSVYNYKEPTLTVHNSSATKSTIFMNSSQDSTDHNTRNNVLLQDFLKTFPNIPESMAKIILGGFNQFSEPPINTFFGNYEQFYQSLMKSTNENMVDFKRSTKRKKKSRKKRRHRRKKKHSSRKKYGSKNRTSSVTLIPNHENNSDIHDEGEKSTGIPLNTFFYGLDIHEKTQNATTGSVTISNEAYENHFYENADLGLIDDDPDDYHKSYSDYDNSYGWFEDYYPIFTDSAAYNANNKEIFVKNLNNDQYYYTRDNEPRYWPFEKHPDENYSFLDQHLPPKMPESQAYTRLEDTKMNNPNNLLNQISVGKRNPLLLEWPDFKTRKVDKSEISTYEDQGIYDDFSDKSSSYSNTKKTFNVRKQSAPKLYTRDRIKDVETVFARSKVAKFGTLSNDNHLPHRIEDLKEKMYENDGTTYVVAEPVVDPLQFFEL